MMIIDSDETLIRRLSEGDDTALTALMDKYLSKIHSYAYQMLGDVMKAEDISQIVFLKVWQMAPNWEFGRGTIQAYLYRLTSHRCLDLLRKSSESLPGTLPEMIDQHPNAERQLSEIERSETIKHALEQLPARQHMAITLNYYQELSLKEAAQTLDMTVSAFDSLLRRARKNLKQILSQPALPKTQTPPPIDNTEISL